MVAEYAAQLLVTPNYLNRIVKRNTGFSAGHHIRQRIVLEAKRMGRFSGAGLKEIAYDLGFLDIAHFSRFFKTFGGTNFSEFKRGALGCSIERGNSEGVIGFSCSIEFHKLSKVQILKPLKLLEQ
jgi:AraC-like DNA-binding protein